jgi:hypothetical protein
VTPGRPGHCGDRADVFFGPGRFRDSGSRKDVGELHMRWGNALEIIGRHRHRRRVERRLDVQCHKHAKENWIDPEFRQQRQEDRDEDDDDLRPFERPAEQEDDDLGEDQKTDRGQIQREHEVLYDRVPTEIREHRREGPGADEQITDHRRGAGG